MINSETEKKNYSRFIEVYRNYPQELAAIAAAERPNLAVSAEAENYNAGTMQKDVDIGLSDNIVIADAVSFERLKAEKVVADGMLPKLENAFKAIANGVSQVVIKNSDNVGNSRQTTILWQ